MCVYIVVFFLQHSISLSARKWLIHYYLYGIVELHGVHRSNNVASLLHMCGKFISGVRGGRERLRRRGGERYLLLRE